MQIKAVVSFVGSVCMAAGEVRVVPDDTARDLIRAGHAIPVGNEAEQPEKVSKKGKGKAS